jgi:diguanylate cyclase (GGDEF)-like protein
MPARVLLLDDELTTAHEIVGMLHEVWPDGLLVIHASGVALAAHELGLGEVSCVIARLRSDPEAGGLRDLTILSAAAADAPIIVISDNGDDAFGIDAVRGGAQDHLISGEITPALLSRSLHYAIERKRSEVRLSNQALQDPLTELPNRALFLDRLSVAMDRSRRTGLAPAVMFLDLDSFKQINDTLGHAAGDRLLTVLAERFRELLRPMDTVARMGGDEFTFLFEGLSGETEALAIAERVQAAAGHPISLDARGGETRAGVSIGIAMVQDPSAPLEDAIRDADAAMYRAKSSGTGIHLHDESSRRRAAQRVSLEDALRTAIQSSQLRVHYQPRVSINGQTDLVGFEALVRLEHPDRGLMAPAEFMEVAEESGLVLPLGDWVLEQALHQVRRWRQSRPGMTISVNLSPRQLADPGLAPRLADALRSSGADASVLWLEVAEDSVVGDDARDARAGLEELRHLGVRLAIDDFGLGHSSLHSLRELPVDMLKIHQSFVSRLDPPGRESALVGAVVDLGHALGLSVVAEGVETDTQLAHVRDAGCDGAQGFLFSRPVPESGVGDLLAAR